MKEERDALYYTAILAMISIAHRKSASFLRSIILYHPYYQADVLTAGTFLLV
jgi:hypothetical protein